MDYMPFFKEYEQQLLGCILKNDKLMEQAVQLKPEDFYETSHQQIFSSMLAIHPKAPINEITLAEDLKKKGQLDEVGGFVTLGNLRSVVLTSANFSYYIEKVKTASHSRKLKEKGQRLVLAIEREASWEEIERLKQEIAAEELQEEPNKLTSLSEYTPQAMTWLLKGAIPDKFPTTIYGDGGLGKSYLGLYFAILAAKGGESFLGLEFPQEARNILYLDWELDKDEFSRRAGKIAIGLGLPNVPGNLFYYSPEKSLSRLLPGLERTLKANRIQFLIIDSLGASCVDPEEVGDIVEVFGQIKNLGIATLILDHQSKMQSQDNYNQKTPYGSVYKYNLSRSVFQLSCIGREENQISLMLRHKKANFGRLIEDLTFDIVFEEDRVMFLESKALTPEEKEMAIIHDAMRELEGKGEKVNQKALILHLKGVLGKDRIISLLEHGKGKYWDTNKGERRELLYESRILKCGHIYNPHFRILKNGDSGEEIDMPEVIT